MGVGGGQVIYSTHPPSLSTSHMLAVAMFPYQKPQLPLEDCLLQELCCLPLPLEAWRW